MKIKALIAEFIGAFALIFVGVGAIASNVLNGGATGLVGIALAHGLTIAVMVGATAAISGGHLNPAVTIGFFVTKKIDLLNGIGYIVAQCLGAIVAAALIKECMPLWALQQVHMGTPALASGVSVSMGLSMEIVLTFFLMFVIYGTAVSKRGTSLLAPLLIGLTITLDIFIGGPVTGAAMNPARYLGPALLGGGLDNLWLYWVGPIIGSVVAAVLFHVVLEEKEKSV